MLQLMKFYGEGSIPALKNERTIFQDGDKIVSLPTREVSVWMSKTSSDIQRQLDERYPDYVIDKSDICGVLVISRKVLHRADVDNQVTTFQEALQGVIVPPRENLGDRFVRGITPVVLKNYRDSWAAYLWKSEAASTLEGQLSEYITAYNEIMRTFEKVDDGLEL